MGPQRVQRASTILPGDTTMPTWPGLSAEVPGPELKNTRSPACSSPASMRTPNGHWPKVVRGMFRPAFRYAM